jgi:hypothetical protein
VPCQGNLLGIEIRARQPIPKAMIVFIIVWNVVILSVLLLTVIHQRAWAFLPALALPEGFLAIWMVRYRRSIAAVSTTSAVAVTVPATAHVLSGDPDQRWVGSGSFPGWFGTMQAAVPLAVLEMFGDVVRLRLRPRLLGLMFGVGPLTATATELEEVFSARRLTGVGIGFRPVDGPTYFLWTSARDEILAVLATHHFAVAWEERKRD